jgi:hypothetical protein
MSSDKDDPDQGDKDLAEFLQKAREGNPTAVEL